MSDIYGDKSTKTENAANISGVLIRSIGGYKFRVYGENSSFVDYEIKHDDLSITIDQDALASFYKVDEDTAILDHSPSVLGLSKS